ncbi:MAG: helix-turn-helix transcriptional regulator [Bacteroidota bacterium]
MQKVQQVILDNLETANFGPDKLAKAVAISRTQLHRKLKALTNTSTSNYINIIRLQEAQKLLMQTDKSISEITYMVGFSSPQYFSKNFSALFGTTPSNYRKQVQKC